MARYIGKYVEFVPFKIVSGSIVTHLSHVLKSFRLNIRKVRAFSVDPQIIHLSIKIQKGANESSDKQLCITVDN